MAFQLEKKYMVLILLVLLALTIFVVTVVAVAGNEGGDLIAMIDQGAGSPIFSTFEQNISPWAIDAGRASWRYRF